MVLENSKDNVQSKKSPSLMLGEYENVKSPLSQSVKSTDMQNYPDALRPGGAIPLTSKEGLGVLYQNVVVGILYGALTCAQGPFLNYYLNTEGLTFVAITALCDITWSFKFFFGTLSDNLPIRGYRRTPYLMIGWFICLLPLLILGFRNAPKPYYPDPAWREIKPTDYTTYMKEHINRDAKNVGSLYGMMIAMITFGYVFADSVADALIVEYSHREPYAIRGRLQSAVYVTRTMSTSVGSVLAGVCLSTPDYGGQMNAGLTISAMMLMLAVGPISALLVSWYCTIEEVFYATEFAEYLSDFWRIIQVRVFYQVVAFYFITSILKSLLTTSLSAIYVYWVKPQPIVFSILVIAANVAMATGIALMGRLCLDYDWRRSFTIILLIIMAFDFTYMFPAIFDLIRNQYYVFGVQIIQNIPYGAFFILECFVTIEIAEKGNEGTTVGLLHTVQNLGSPVSTTIMKVIDSQLHIRNDDVANDTPAVRRDVTISFLIATALKTMSFAFLGLLPRQKYHVYDLKMNGGSSKKMAIFTIVYIAATFIWTITSSLLSMFESTRCFATLGNCEV